jgi:hypothetical protein
MCASEMRRRVAAWALMSSLGLALGCDDPVQPIAVPDLGALHVFMVLDPDQPTQLMLVQLTSDESLIDLRGVVSAAGREIATGTAERDRSLLELTKCVERYGTLVGFPWCMELPFTPEHGVSYRVSVSARDSPPASATTTIPGAFSIVSHSVGGSPPGTGGLKATWTTSTNAFRYVIAMRGTPRTNCASDSRCTKRWFAVTTDTTIDTSISADYLEEATGPWYLDVYAMNEELYTHLTTGAPGTFFPVPPAQNVAGGFGAVGSWVRRSVPVATQP